MKGRADEPRSHFWIDPCELIPREAVEALSALARHTGGEVVFIEAAPRGEPSPTTGKPPRWPFPQPGKTQGRQ
jgi:hypothetical protein